MALDKQPSLIAPHLERAFAGFCTDLVSDFKELSKTLAILPHLLTGLLFIEFICCFFTFRSYPFMFACLLGALFLTAVFKILLNFYLQTRKPEQWLQLKEKFVHSCLCSLGEGSDEREINLPISAALLTLTSRLEGVEERIYSSPFLKKVSAWVHYQDQFDFQELLFLSSIERSFAQARLVPTDIETHLSIGNSCFALAKLYQSYKGSAFRREKRAQIEKRRILSIKNGIEEFTILKEYVPNDPGIRLELARGYCLLGMHLEEAKEYEEIVRLRPDDEISLARLGSLYFLLQEHAKGLSIYDRLCKMGSSHASELILFYGEKFNQLLDKLGN